MTNGAKYLPDSFKKSTDSTNYKLLQLLHLAELDAKADFNSIIEYRNIKNAYGKTLDRYGEMVGISRNGATDEQYRLKIRGKLARMASDGTCNKIISLTADMVGVEPESISIKENDMSIAIKGITLDALENTGCKSAEITSAIAETLPAGVSLEPPVYAGTLGIMGKVETYEDGTQKYTVSYDENGNYQYFLYNHNPTTPEFIKRMASSQYDEHYPTLAHAWYLGMMSILTGRHNEGATYDSKKHDIGLSGKGEVPIRHSMYDDNGDLLPSMKPVVLIDSGTFDGGTLSLISGEDD